MKEHPIIFQGWGARAILEGRKTQTRRVIRNTSRLENLMMAGEAAEWCPYGRPGDLLWVRETWAPCDCGTCGGFIYRADGEPPIPVIWHPSIHMPRRASRLTLRITDVRAQRVQEISEKDARAEGCISTAEGLIHGDGTSVKTDYRLYFKHLWDSINAKRGYGWDDNPWIWALTFGWVKP